MKTALFLASCSLVASQDLFLESHLPSEQRMSKEQKGIAVLKDLEKEFGAEFKHDPLPNVPCMMRSCAKEVGECVTSSIGGEECLKTLKCTLKCSFTDDGHNRAPGCAYLCEMTSGYKSPHYTEMIECIGQRHKCLPDYPDDGDCLATDADAVQNITSFDQIEGDWWVVKGINCGQVNDSSPFRPSGKYVPPLKPTVGRNYPGGYDWYPCQHERFVRSNGRDFPNPTTPWVNNITYCGGANGGLQNCTTDMIDTVANVTMCAPGVVCHNYTDAPLKPQFEHWRIISAPHPDWLASIWCGGTPVVTYNGGIALGRNKRTAADMPKWVEETFRAAYKKFGVDWDQMCPSTNEGCP